MLKKIWKYLLNKPEFKPSLMSTANDYYTDKNTVHSYLPIYQKLFGHKDLKNILEIGIQRGGSIKLWSDYFPNAHVFGIDLTDELICLNIKDRKNISLIFKDAYSEDIINELKDIKFDLIIDDGNHVLDSMKKAMELYLPMLKDDGIFIIEDLRDIQWLDILKGVTPLEDRKYIKKFDLRRNKNRWDDILFVIDRG